MDYKSVFTNLCLELQQNRSWIKGLGKNPFTHSLTAVPFVRGHRSVFPRIPRNTGVYTSHPSFVTATSGVLTRLPAKLSKNGMRVYTLSDRQSEQKLRVYTASEAKGLRPKKKVSPLWSSVGFKIGAMIRFFCSFFVLFGDLFFFILFLPMGKYVIHCIRGDQISHEQTMVAKRGLTNRANVHTPMWKSRLFQSIQQFWLQLDIVSFKKIRNKLKMPMCGSESARAETRNRELRHSYWGA